MIEQMALLLIGELEREPHPAQLLIVDHISAAFAAHLLRSYNGFEPGVTAIRYVERCRIRKAQALIAKPIFRSRTSP